MRAFRVLSFSLSFLLVPLLPSAEAQEPLRIIGWNAESCDANPATIRAAHRRVQLYRHLGDGRGAKR